MFPVHVSLLKDLNKDELKKIEVRTLFKPLDCKFCWLSLCAAVTCFIYKYSKGKKALKT